MNGDFEQLLLGMKSASTEEHAVRYQELCDRQPREVFEGLVAAVRHSEATRFVALVLLGRFISQKESLFLDFGDAGFHDRMRSALIEAFGNPGRDAAYVSFVLSRLVCVYSKMGLWVNPIEQLLLFIRSDNRDAVLMGIDAMCMCIENGSVDSNVYGEVLHGIVKSGLESQDAELVVVSLRLLYACLTNKNEMLLPMLSLVPQVIAKFVNSEHIHTVMSNLTYFFDQNEAIVESAVPMFLELITQIIGNPELDEVVRTHGVLVLDTFMEKCPTVFMNNDMFLRCFDLYVSVFKSLDTVADSLQKMSTLFQDATMAITAVNILVCSEGKDAAAFHIFGLVAPACGIHLLFGFSEDIMRVYVAGYTNQNVEVRTAAFRTTKMLLALAARHQSDFRFESLLPLLQTVIPAEVDSTARKYEIRTLAMLVKYHSNVVANSVEALLHFLDALLSRASADQLYYAVVCYKYIADHFHQMSTAAAAFLMHVFGTRTDRALFFKCISVATSLVRSIQSPELVPLCEILLKILIESYALDDITYSERRIVDYAISEVVASEMGDLVSGAIPTILNLLLKNASQDFIVSTCPTHKACKSDFVEYYSVVDTSENVVLSIQKDQVRDIAQSLLSLAHVIDACKPEVAQPFAGEICGLVHKLLGVDKWKATYGSLLLLIQTTLTFFEPSAAQEIVMSLLHALATEECVSVTRLPGALKRLTRILEQIDVTEDMVREAMNVITKAQANESACTKQGVALGIHDVHENAEVMDNRIADLLAVLSEKSPVYSTIAAPYLSSLVSDPALSVFFKSRVVADYSRRCLMPSDELLGVCKSFLLSSVTELPTRSHVTFYHVVRALGVALSSNRYDTAFFEFSMTFLLEQWNSLSSREPKARQWHQQAIQFAWLLVVPNCAEKFETGPVRDIFLSTLGSKLHVGPEYYMKCYASYVAEALTGLLSLPLEHSQLSVLLSSAQSILAVRLPLDVFRKLVSAACLASERMVA